MADETSAAPAEGSEQAIFPREDPMAGPRTTARRSLTNECAFCDHPYSLKADAARKRRGRLGTGVYREISASVEKPQRPGFGHRMSSAPDEV